MIEALFKQLESKIDLLSEKCDRLRMQQISAHQSEQRFIHEREQLLDKNNVARLKVESIIDHLKTIEKSCE